MTTAAPRHRALVVTDHHRADFDRLVKALRFDPLAPPEMLPTECLAQYLARVFDLPNVHRAYGDGRKVDEAASARDALVQDAHAHLSDLRRTIHLAAARSVADGKTPKVDAKAQAALAAARDRADYLAAWRVSGGNYLRASEATERAAEALNTEPRTVAAQVVTLAAALGAHETVRRSIRIPATLEGRPRSDALIRVIANRPSVPSWLTGKTDEDRRYIHAMDVLARQWADATVIPAIRERMGVA